MWLAAIVCITRNTALYFGVDVLPVYAPEFVLMFAFVFIPVGHVVLLLMRKYGLLSEETT
jgi:hypothetical protein